MKLIEVKDTLEPLGIAAGVLLVLMALGTVAGTPWTTNGSILATLVQLFGVVAMVGVGIGLARLSYVD